MTKLAPILAILAAAIVVAVILFGGESGEDGTLPDGEDYIGDDQKDPELMAAEAVRRKQAADAEAARREAARKAAQAPSGPAVLFLEGEVVDAATGKGIGTATLSAERAREPCPRLPAGMLALLRSAVPGVSRLPAPMSTRVAPDGRFVWKLDPAARSGPLDVFAEAPGYVLGALCKPTPGSRVTIRLRKALRLKVRVTDRHGRPVEGARATVQPDEATADQLGHVGLATTDKHGRCEVDGLLPGAVTVTADHPAYMPTSDGPFDPATLSEVELRLPPAMRFTFQLRSDDGSEIKNPTLRWRTDGNPPHEDLLLLPARGSGPPNAPLSEVKTDPVRVPCNHRNVQLELKADGFEPWRPAAEPLPAEGGEKDMIVVLVRDTSLASLRVHFQDTDGEKVGFAEMKGIPAITRLDAKDPGSVVIESGESLFFPALPAGPYRIGVRSPDYAPVETDVDVIAGEKNESTVKLRPPAKLKVTFVSTERLVVRFRLRRDGRILPAFPVGGKPVGTQASGLQPLIAHGSEGAVFTGLDTGPVTVDVTDPTIAAETKTVQLREGETAEVEIEVRKR